MDMDQKYDVAIDRKFLLTIEEAAAYTSIGTKKIRELAKEPDSNFTVRVGNKYLIRRTGFEDYLIKHCYL
ncbi:MAG: excisionase family DNA-binding protein [Lachnospiraceae bacterium]|nr:excisionase family DNA-binding protein [Lachnospiraceae bacterium]